MARELTEQQQKFLAVLFDEAGGDVLTAKKLAGYSDTTTTTQVVKASRKRSLMPHKCLCLTMHLKQLWLWWVHCTTQLN